MLGDLLKSFGRQRAAAASTHDALEAVRIEIAKKAREIETIRMAPQTREAALTAFDAWADQAATKAVDRLPIGRLLEAQASARGLHIDTVMAGAQPIHQPALEMLTGLIFLGCRDRLREIVSDQIDDLLGGRQGLTPDQRAAQIALAEAELHSLCLAEERLVREMEGSGLAVIRRRDAPAYALLAAAVALPQV